MQVGDELEMKVSLTTPDEPIEEIIWIKVVEPEYPKEPTPKEEESFENIGLPGTEKGNTKGMAYHRSAWHFNESRDSNVSCG